VPTTSGHPHWITVNTTRTVLIVVHTVTAWNRLADILSIFDSDRRVQLVFTFPDVSNVTGDVERDLADEGAIVLPWGRAITTRFDAAISVHHSGNLHQIRAPLAVMSHGIGYTKVRKPETGNRKPETGNVYGLAPEWLLHNGIVVPEVVVLAHERERDRLELVTPEALDRAVVAGDPCYERMRASTAEQRDYRTALGANPDTTIVTVSSTWGPGSLLGQHPDLISDLVSELELDDHLVTAVVHPNVWFAHGPWQLRTWLADALRSGLRLIPPIRGWQQTILASNAVIGDHGAVTGYAAALGIPTLLASFPHDEIAPGSAIDLLGRAAPRLNPRQPLADQVRAAIAEHDRQSMAEVTALASSLPDDSAQTLRSTFYKLMDLPEPHYGVPVFPYPAADLRPHHKDVQACWVTCERDTTNNAGNNPSGNGDAVDDRVLVHRWPADVTARSRRGPRATDALLAVHSTHPRRDLRNDADIIVLPDDQSRHVDDVLTRTLRQRPGCTIAVAAIGGGRYRVYHRQAGALEIRPREPLPEPLPAAIAAAVIHNSWHGRVRSGWPPRSLTVRVGTRSIHAELAPFSCAGHSGQDL
jgi:hypothetical protein